MKVLVLGLVIIGIPILYLYWRFFFFFRDPERSIPVGNDAIVSPADGTVIYVREIDKDSFLFSTKKKRNISLKEYCADQNVKLPCFLIGIFMHPTSVHVNRAPISGRVERIDYRRGRNLPMTLTWWRVNLGMKPFEKYAQHLFTNERNIIGITGKIKVVVIQIADIYVNKIDCWVKEHEAISKGQRIGMIKMGSQVDVLIPREPGIKVIAREGQNVKAGETIIAYYHEGS